MVGSISPDKTMATVGGDEILVEDFSSPIHSWATMNDPVMGGESRSSFVVEEGVVRFAGTCEIVGFLDAPGFVTLQTGRRGAEHFPVLVLCPEVVDEK